jgi:hypothetical protein
MRVLAVDLGIGPAQPGDRHLVQFGPESTIENDGALQGEQADARGSVPRHGSVDHHRLLEHDHIVEQHGHDDHVRVAQPRLPHAAGRSARLILLPVPGVCACGDARRGQLEGLGLGDKNRATASMVRVMRAGMRAPVRSRSGRRIRGSAIGQYHRVRSDALPERRQRRRAGNRQLPAAVAPDIDRSTKATQIPSTTLARTVGTSSRRDACANDRAHETEPACRRMFL